MSCRFLTALPIYNEKGHVQSVLEKVRETSAEILVVDDGSTDGTTSLLEQEENILLLTHSQNRGYGAALQSAFQYAMDHEYEVLVTIDCDGQHEPQRIPQFVETCQQFDIVSGSRYLKKFPGDGQPPEQRKDINLQILAELRDLLGLELTDAFCGFKAYRVAALESLQITNTGYAMPLELWVQAVHHRLKIKELAVPLIYLEESRSFGGTLDDGKTRLQYYQQVIRQSMLAIGRTAQLPEKTGYDNSENLP